MPQPEPCGWLTRREDGVRCRVKVTPRAARAGVQGIEADAGGDAWLAVRVVAPPDSGRANAELMRLLVRRWGVAARDLRLVSAAAARRKVLHLSGPADELCERLAAIERAGGAKAEEGQE